MHAGIWTGEHSECFQSRSPRACFSSVHHYLNVPQPYLFCNNRTVRLEVVGSREERYALQLRRTCYAGSHWAVLSSETGDRSEIQEALDRCLAVNEALPQNYSRVVQHAQYAGGDQPSVYVERIGAERWDRGCKVSVEKRMIPLLFCKLTLRGMAVSIATCP